MEAKELFEERCVEPAKENWRKGLLVAMIQKETTVKLDWIREQLNMGTRAVTCRLAAQSRRLLAIDRVLRYEIEAISKKAILNGCPPLTFF